MPSTGRRKTWQRVAVHSKAAPVKAKLAQSPAQWPWSSARAHIAGHDDALVTVRALLERVGDVAQFLSDEADPELEQALAKGQSVGRPLMDDEQLVRLEKRMKRRLRPAQRGRPRTIRKGGASTK